MKVKLNEGKVYLTPTVEERKIYIPLLATAKLDRPTGLFTIPTQGILPLITIVPKGILYPETSQTKKLLEQGYALLQMMAKYKGAITDPSSDVRSAAYPFLMKHQAVCNSLARFRSRYAFFLDTGTR